MPQWAGSSWYFLRYVDNHNDKELVSREKADEMLPVDMYIGGVEHAVLHLLYSRFYTKFLYDIGVVDFDEPFHKLFNQGMITGKNGIKMSKSKGNVVSPDDLVRDYGCDSLRMYELFVGPPELDAEWDDRGIDGVNRFLKRVWNLVMDSKDADITATKEMIKERHKLVYDVTTRLESFSLNTVISAFMEHNNKLLEIAKKEGGIDKETLSTMAVLLSPFAPHVAEELWEELGHTESVFKAGWPKYDENAMKDDEIKVPVQINGKTKAVIEISADASKEEALAAGADFVGAEDLIPKIQNENWFGFDVAVATPDMMGVVGRLGKVLGPKGLMPNPKVGTVTPNVAQAVKNAKAGQVQFRADKAGIIHAPVGRVSFETERLVTNIKALVEQLNKLKPASQKGIYLRKLSVSSTMGIGARVDLSSL